MVTRPVKMKMKATVVFFLVLIKTASLQHNNKFVVVSTTEPSTVNHNDLNNIKTDIKEIKIQINNLQNTLNRLYKNQNVQTTTYAKNCKELQDQGHKTSGVYRIQPISSEKSFQVYCDMTTRGGGWTYLMNRFDGSEDFYLGWDNYKIGFGNLAGEFWLGLEHMHQLTGYEPTELLVELVDWNSTKVFATYSLFSIGTGTEGYSIKVLGEHSGDAGDSLRYHAGMKFSTDDFDQDRDTGGNCASYYKAAWWYKGCSETELTAKYTTGAVDKVPPSVMYWDTFRGTRYGLKKARMMVRPT